MGVARELARVTNTGFAPSQSNTRPLWVIRDRVGPAASPAMSVIVPKAEVNSERGNESAP
jgi:hypothetical protein